MVSEPESVLTAFHSVAAKRGDHPAALEAGQLGYTYAQLRATAADVADQLRALDVGPEQTVGLCLPKSAAYVAALLGVWEAGAAFVPIDPEWPSERQDWIARDARLAATVLPLRAAIPACANRRRVVRVPMRAAMPSDGPAPARQPVDVNSLAYVIYTSGSTGKPKGVAVTHRGIVPMLRDQIAAFAVTPESRGLLYLSTAFDASISDIGTVLLAGGTLCIEPPAALHPGPAFLRLLAERGITHLDFPPSLLGLLDVEQLPVCLQTVIIGGEVADPAAVRRWAGRVRLVNVYGPTEATVCTSLCRCDEHWDRAWIGEPIAGMQYDVVDDDLQPMPTDQAGELVIAGPGLARKYWGKSALTSERFVARAGERWYRTRDRVARHADGRIEFLGRIDRQIKLRGRLIEPGEIEARLAAHPAVARAACLLREAGRKELVAFVELRTGQSVDARGLRRWLAATLPRWMLPQRFAFLERLPQTSSGKADLQQLAEWTLPEREITSSSEAGLLGQLRRIWRETLLVDEIADDDDFFELGGDSLAALELTALAETQGLFFSPALVYAEPTVARMAAALEASSREAGEAMSADVLRADVAALVQAEGPLLEAAKARPKAALASPGAILVTGATGFLGAHLLAELLHQTAGSEVVCLVRAANDGHAQNKLERTLSDYALQPIPMDMRRVRAICGDVSKPKFGLADAEWESLAERVDAIYHVAAHVNLIEPYAALRTPNVLGTREAMRLQAHGRPKALHYASTLSVLVSTDRNQGELLETDDLSAVGAVYGGYAQSKFAAELLLQACGEAAGPVTHYRLGLLTWHSRSGRAAPRDLLGLFVRGITALGCFPSGADDVQLDMTSIDYAARAMARLSRRGDVWHRAGQRTFHLANPGSVRFADLVRSLREAGRPLAEVSPEEFRQRLAGTLTGPDRLPQAAACLALCRALKPQAYASHRSFDLFQATGVTFGVAATHAALAAAGCPPEELAPPRITPEFLAAYWR